MTVFIVPNIVICVLRYGYCKVKFNIGFVGVIMTLAYERKSILEVLALFKYISQDNLQRLRLLTSSDVKSKPIAYS